MMNQPDNGYSLDAFFLKLLEGEIDAEEFAWLDAQISQDPKVARYYLEYIANFTAIKLNWRIATKKQNPLYLDSSLKSPSIPIELSSTPNLSEDKVREIEQYANRQLEAYLRAQDKEVRPKETRRWDLGDLFTWIKSVQERLFVSYRVAARTAKVVMVCMFIGLIGLIIWGSIVGTHMESPVPSPVASVVEMADVVWDGAMEQSELLPGPLHLWQGMAKIKLKQGAEVILQAPCQCVLQTTNHMILTAGSLCARVPETAKGFTVDTPLSRIVDMGTEFGITVDGNREAEVHVFEGEVGLASTVHSTTSPFQSVSEGQAALIADQTDVQVQPLKERSKMFRRSMTKERGFGIPGKCMDLTDVVAGGSGFSTGENLGSINPFNGNLNDTRGRPGLPRIPPQLGDKIAKGYYVPGPRRYIPVPQLPYVDGLFVPQSDTPFVISSQGHVFQEEIDVDGWFIFNVLSVTGPMPDSLISELSQSYTGILLHPNLGITFDMQRMRRAMPGVEIVAFTSLAGIPLSPEPHISEADMWVLVDGHVRYKRQGIRGSDVWNIHVPILSSERFLTLIATDGESPGEQEGNYDHCFFIDPILELKPAQ